MTDAYDLIAAARSRFGELSAAEQKVLHAVARGEVAYCGPSDQDDDPANDPAKADQWGKERTIRANLIRWLCVDREASERIDPRGIQVHGAKIGSLPEERDLDLSGADLPFRLSFTFCNFDVPLMLADATILALSLGGSRIARLDLRHAVVGPIGDDEQSWPKKGSLFLDGFTYERIGEGPTSAKKRLEWIARQPEGFTPQPYRQLAKVLREAGDDSGARKVLIAMEDARLKHGGLSFVQRWVQRLLGATVGYGYVPLRALWYIAFFVILGTLMFGWGNAAGVMARLERKGGPEQVEPFNAFIYSVETFIPGANLHLANYWMPDPWRQPIALAWPFSESLAPTPHYLGAYLRWYLWAHTMLGWFFVLIFAAGITGLVRRE
jgi:hypothetical protein